MRGLLPDLQRGSAVSPGAPVQAQLLRELPLGPVQVPGTRRCASGGWQVDRMPAVPTHHIHLRSWEDPSRAEGGRERTGAADGCGTPQRARGGRSGSRGRGGSDSSRDSSRGERVFRGHRRRETPAVFEESLAGDKRQGPAEKRR